MSHHSPPSSAGAGPSSSPFAGTDPTLYSPELVRSTHAFHHTRNNISQVTVVASNQPFGSVDRPSDKCALRTTLISPAPYVQGAFVNEIAEDDKCYLARFQIVSQLPDGTGAGMDMDHELFSVQHQMKLYACFSTCVPTFARGVYLRYDDLHDAAEGKDILEQHGFIINYVSGYDFALAKSQDTAQLNEFEGQVQLPVLIKPNPDHALWEFTSEDLDYVIKCLESSLSTYGAIRNCVHVDTNDAKMVLTFRIEFHSVDAANRAVQSLRIDQIWGVNNQKAFSWLILGPSHWTGERALNSPHRTKPRVDDRGRFVGYRPAPDAYAVDAQFYRHPHDQHNRVRRERILDGSDVRTTVMLRNIPNKLDWLSLKTLLDDVCFGTFDFVYLRIDFKSGCNVGYAFINFADVQGMIALLDRLDRRCWVGFRSAKAAEISYATIQGREALVQKFRNSSVMQETPFCRPRLFITYADAQIMHQPRDTGTEQAFPRPDNLSKLQRSIDSARSVGLYPPHGHYTVVEHRNRSSAYDRGTPRDMNQTATFYARQPAAVSVVPFLGLSDIRKRDIEVWYYCINGEALCQRIPFEYIPAAHIAQYIIEHPIAAQELAASGVPVPGIIGAAIHTALGTSQVPVPGVIGTGINSTYGTNFTSAGAMTPTRGPRMTHPPTKGKGKNVANSFS